MLKRALFYRLVSAIALLALSLNFGSPVMPTQAQRDTPAIPAQTGGAGFQPLTGDSPLAPPYLNAQPVTDREEARGNSIQLQRQHLQAPSVNKFGQEQAVSFAPDQVKAVQSLDFSSSAARGAAPKSLTNLPTLLAPKSLGEKSAPAFDPVAAMGTPVDAECYSWLYNPGLDNGTGWTQYYPYAMIDKSAYYSAPNSIQMIDNSDGYYANNGYDLDLFGQSFDFPYGINSLEINFKSAEINAINNPADALYLNFYQVEPNGNLSQISDLPPIPLVGDGYWNSYKIQENYNPYIQYMQGKRVALVFELWGNRSSPSLDVSLDDIDIRMCTSTVVPTHAIVGQVTQSPTRDLSDALILLTYEEYEGAEPEVLKVTLPDADGYYVFDTLLGLPAEGIYRVWFMNLFDDDSRVTLWAGPLIGTSFNNGDIWLPNPFDISNVPLTAPANESEVVLKNGVDLQWYPRYLPGEAYYVCLYDSLSVLDYNTVCTTGPIEGSSLSINESNFNNVPGFLVYGHRYLWYVMPAVAKDEVDYTYSEVGYSYYASGVTLLASAPVNFTEPPPSGSLTPSSKREWLLMIYLAGDNSLGDPANSGSESSFIDHFNTLMQISPSFTTIHVVTLSDFYDSSGTQICYLSVSPAQCKQLGEQDTADPATLANFIKTAEANYPHNRSALIISDHGHGISGLAVDETTHHKAGVNTIDGYMMNPNELRAGLANAGLNSTLLKLDLIYFNTCLMGNLETAYNVKDFASYMVASSNEMWMTNVYPGLLPLFTSTVSDENLAIGIANNYVNIVKAKVPGYPYTIAAYDLARTDSVRQAVSDLGAWLVGQKDKLMDAMKTLRIEVQLYDSSGDEKLDEQDALVDLTHLNTLIANSTSITDPQVKTLADNVNNSLGSFILTSQAASGRTKNGASHNLSNAHGLSIYFPDRNEGTQLTLTRMIKDVLPTYTNGNQWVTFTDDFINETLGNPDTDPGGNSASGPVNIQSGVLPPDGSVSSEFILYLPAVRR